MRGRPPQHLWQMQGHHHRWFIGAYAFHGMPLLEGCIASGLLVAQRLGVDERLAYPPLPDHEAASCAGAGPLGLVAAAASVQRLLACLLPWAALVAGGLLRL